MTKQKNRAFEEVMNRQKQGERFEEKAGRRERKHKKTWGRRGISNAEGLD